MQSRFSLLLKLTLLLTLTFVFSSINAQKNKTTSVTKTSVYSKNVSWIELMQDSTVNFYDVQKAFYSSKTFKKYKKAVKEESKEKGIIKNNKEIGEEEGIIEPASLFKRWENNMAPRVYPTGIRPKQDMIAKEYDKFIKLYPDVLTPHKSGTKSATGTWTLVGPNGAPGGTTPNGSYQSPAGAGRVNCIRFNPLRSNTMWIGTPCGGAWRSYNGGTTWIPSSDKSLSMGVSDIAVASDTNIIYMATGDADAGDSYSIGILKSTDAGSTWQPTSFTCGVSSGIRIYKLLAYPGNSDIIYAATNAGLYKTTNGFATYTRIGASSIGICYDVEFKPGTPATIYAAGKGLWYSTNDGSTWNTSGGTLPTTGIQRVAIAVSAALPNNVWALYGQSSDQGFYGFFTSTNSGATFATTYATGTTHDLLGWNTDFSFTTGQGGQAFYDLSLAVNPSTGTEFFVGGVNLQKSTNTTGSAWVCNAYWLKGAGYQYAHADHHAVEYLPGSTTTLFDGDDGGIFKSTDNGATWTDLSGTLAIGQIAGIGASQQNVMLSGWQDNGSNLDNNGTWTIVYGGDGCEAIVDPTNNSIIYESYVDGEINRSTNSGSTWTTIANPGTNGIPAAEVGSWITPYVMHPTSNTTLYAGYINLYRSTNSGSAWTQMGTCYKATGESILRIAVAPSSPTTIYVIKLDTIFKTSDDGANWTNITGTLAGYAFSDITVKNNDPNTVWVTVSGYNSGSKVFKSTDGGTTWVNYSSNLPNIPFNAIVADKNNIDDGVYAGGDMGIYYRDNVMPNWTLFNSGLPNAVIKELEIYYDATPANSKLRAGTYGRGLWQSDIYTRPDIAPVAGISSDKTGLNACSGYIVNYQDASDNIPTSWSWSFPGGTPSSSTLQNPTVTYPSTTATYSVSLTVTNSKGSNSITKTNYITVGEKTAPLEENFASTTFPPAQWTNSIWMRGTAVGADGTSGGAVLFNCFALSNGSTGNLTTMNVDLSGVTTPYLKFNVAYRQYASETDRLQVWISNNCGGTWSNIYDKSGTTLMTLAASTTSFTPSASTDWRAESVDLAAYVNQKVMVKFTGISNYGNNIWVDDIKIGEQTCSVAAAGVISGTTSLCQGTTGYTYSVPAITNATGYVWTLPTGATITSGDNTRSITVDYSQSALSGNITVKGTAACGSGISSSLAITVNQIPAAALPIVGPDVCSLPQTGLVYQIPYITNYTIGQTGYVWTLPPGGSITAGNNTNKITVNFTGGATAGDIIVYGQNGCGNGNPSPALRITMGTPGAPVSITGVTSVCKGDNEIPYSVAAVPGADSYVWSVPSGATIASGSGTNSITVNFSASAVSGNISVYAVNTCGNSSTTSAAITATVAPALPSSILGPLTPTPGTSQTYSVTNVGGVSYFWTVPSDWIITAGQGTNSITVTVGYANGNFTVTPSSGSCTGPTQALGITLSYKVKTRVTGAANWSAIATWIKVLTGTASFTSGSAAVTGTATVFTTELSVGDIIMLDATPGTTYTILSITDNTHLTLTGNAGATASGAFGKEAVPASANDVQIGNTALAAAVTVTLDVVSTNIKSLTFISTAYANLLTHSGTNALNIRENVIIDQPTAALTAGWSINGGSASVGGNVTLYGTNTTATRIARLLLTSGSITITGNLVLTAAAAACSKIDLSGGAATVNLAKALTVTNSLGTITPGTTSTFNFNGTTGQTIPIGISAVTYANMQTNNTSTAGATITAAISAANVVGNLSIQSGTFNNGGFAIVLNAKALSVSNGATFNLTGTTTMVTGTSSKTFGATSTVNYAGAAQTVTVETYGNLILSGSGTKTMPASTITVAGNFSTSGSISATALAAINVTGNVTLGLGTTYNAGSFTHSINGDWTNNGGTFTPSTSTINFSNTTSDQTINGTLSTQTFNNLTIAKSSSKLNISGSTTNVIVSGTLTMTSGNIDCGANTITLGTSTASVGTLSYTSGNIIGNFMRWINATGSGILFPVGTSSDNRKALVTFTNLTNGSLTAKFIATDPGSTGLPLSENSFNIQNQFTEGYWSLIAANSLASTNYALELTGTNFASFTEDADVRIIKRPSGGGPWTLNGTHVTGVSPTAKRSGLSGFSEFAHAKASAGSVTPVATVSNTPGCSTGIVTVISDQSGTQTYELCDNGGATLQTWTGSATSHAFSGLANGTYKGKVTLGSNTSALSSATTLTNNVAPVATASNNGPVCAGASLTLTGGPGSMTTYAWSGPLSYSNATQSPTVSANVTTAMTGTYTITVTDANGCTGTASTTATVNAKPTATATNNGPVCAGAALTLTGGPGSMTTYAWSGPLSYSNATQSPTVSANATTSMTGTYTLIVTDANGCTGTASTAATVNAKPVATVVNTPGCGAGTVTVSSDQSGSQTYELCDNSGATLQTWTGNATSHAFTALASGTYKGKVTLSTCTSTLSSATILNNNNNPVATTANNGPVCAGASLTLTGGPGSMTTYAWSGPLSYSNATQSPTVSANATTAMTGTYTLTVTDANGCTGTASTAATVNAKPTATATNNGPVCAGAALTLTGGPGSMTTYAWSGPLSYSNATQSPTVSANATTAMTGTYTLTVTDANGCTGTASTAATVNAIPTAPTSAMSDRTNFCSDDAGNINLSITGGSGTQVGWYTTSCGGILIGTGNPLSIASPTTTTTYYARWESGSCYSTCQSTSVNVNALPTATASNNGPVTAGNPLTLTGGAGGLSSYAWSGPLSYSNNTQNPTVSASATIAMSGTYIITVTDANGCTNTASTTATVNPSGTTYYLTTAGVSAAQTASNWNTGGIGGGGTAASNFTTSGDIFIISSGQSARLAGNATFGAGVTLQIDGAMINPAAGGTRALTINGTIIFTNSTTVQISGARYSFTLGSGATMKTANQNGVYAATASNCSIGTLNASPTFNAGANYEFNGAAQSMTGIPATVNNLTFSGSGAKTLLNTLTTVSGNLTISGTATTSAVVGLTIGGTLSIGTGTTFTGGAFTHNVAGNWTNTGGTFTLTGTTINLNGTAQSITGTTAFNNLIFAGSGVKSIATGASVTGKLTINSGVTANVGAGLTISVGTLKMGGLNKINGTWGSTTSTATNQDNTYFAATTGKLNITTDSRPTPTFSGLTASQSLCYGTATTTLSGTVSATGPIYPAIGETVSVTINGSTQPATISGGAGVFSVSFPTATIPASVTPYTITYAYTGDVNLTAASNNTSTSLTVNAKPVATATNSGPTCLGSALSLTGGPAAMSTYTWTGPNSFSNGTQSPLVSATATLAMAGTYTLSVTDGNGCTNTATTAVTVNTPVAVSVSISANPGTTILTGASVTFTANATNGGTTPSYQWKVNGSNVGTNSSTYTTSSLAHGDIVTCLLTSDLVCTSGNPATSNSLTMIVNNTVNLSVMLEGLFDSGSGQMHEALDGNTSNPEYGVGIADKITVVLHASTYPYGVVATIPNIVLHTDGSASLTLAGYTGSYYIAIQHRNSIEIWSANPISFATGTINYNFASSDSQTYGNNVKQVATGIYAAMIGDVNQDGVVDIFDLIDMDSDLTDGSAGFLVNDLNGDGVVDIFDLIIVDDNLTNGASIVTP